MTDRELMFLCAFAAVDLPAGARGTLGELVLRARFSTAGLTARLAVLRLDAYVNRNDENGFVAMAFVDGTSGAYCAFRGSETRLADGEAVDWTDNFAAPFACSAQYPDAARMANRYADVPVVFTGHSKGGHNALYALASTGNPRASATAFNAQGFTRGQLDGAQVKRLSDRGRNLVAANDIVGALLYHPEKRVFARYSGSGFPHALRALTVDESGAVVPGRRPVWSYALEWGTRAAARTLRGDSESCALPSERAAM